jgi:hypothetical protein
MAPKKFGMVQGSKENDSETTFKATDHIALRNQRISESDTTTTTTTNKKPSTTELIAARKARSGKSTATTKPVARSGKWKPGDPKYPAWVGTGGSGSGDAYLLKGNVAMQNWIESSKQKSWPKNK